MLLSDDEAPWAAAAPGIFVVAAGVVGLVVALVVRDAWRAMATERNAVFELRLKLERREAELAEQARSLAEWEGRLHQIAECGCCLPRRRQQCGAGAADGLEP